MTTALEGVRGQPHAPAAFYPWERPGTHCTGSWVGPRAGLDRCENLAPPGFDPRTVQPVAQSVYRLSYPAHKYYNFILYYIVLYYIL